MVIVEIGIGPITATIPPIHQVNIVDCCVYLVLLAVFKNVFMIIKPLILGVMVEFMEFSHKRVANLTFTITDKVLTMVVELNLGLRPAPIPPIIQVSLVDC